MSLRVILPVPDQYAIYGTIRETIRAAARQFVEKVCSESGSEYCVFLLVFFWDYTPLGRGAPGHYSALATIIC